MFYASLISLMVSVDVKHLDYLHVFWLFLNNMFNPTFENINPFTTMVSLQNNQQKQEI